MSLKNGAIKEMHFLPIMGKISPKSAENNFRLSAGKQQESKGMYIA